MSRELTTAAPTAPSPSALTTDPSGNLDISSLGRVLVASGFFADLKSQSQAIVKVLMGRELGISDLTAVMNIHIIKGKPSLSAQLIATRIKLSGRYKYRVTELDAQHCVIKWWTRDTPTGDWEALADSMYSISDAKTSRLAVDDQDSNWRKWPKNMLMWRALVLGQRMHAPEVTLGVAYLPDEMGAAMDETGTQIDVTPEPSAPEPPRPASDRPSVLDRVAPPPAAPAGVPPAVPVPAAEIDRDYSEVI